MDADAAPGLGPELAALCDAVPLALCHVDMQGRCLHVNHAWQALFGRGPEDCLGESWLRGLHADDREPVREAWATAMGAAAAFERTFRICRPDGSVRQVRLRAQPIGGARLQDAPPTGYMGVVDDLTDALLAEQQRRDAHALVARTGRMAGVGGWVLELATHRLSWTDEMSRLHEMPAAHRPSFDETLTYYPASARPVIERAIAQALHDGTPWDLELPFVTAAGRHRWVRTQGEAEFDAGAPVRLVGTIQDVSERRAAEAAVREGQQLLRVLYEATPALLLSVDATGEILTVSDLWLDRLGYARSEVVGRPATHFLPAPAGEGAGLGPLRDVFRLGRLRNLPLQLRRADGGLLDVRLSAVADRDAGGRARRALIVLDDVSETVARSAELEQEQALRQQAQRHAEELDRLLAERSQMLDVLAHEVRQPLNNASAAMQSAAAALAGRSEADVSARLARAQSVLGHVLAGVDNTLAAAALLAGNGPLARQDTELDTLIGVTLADLMAADRGRVVVEIATSARTVSIDLGLMRLALRNLLANALRHGGAGTPVRLRVLESEDPPAIAFEIADQGPGFEPALLPRLFERGARGRRGGHGLGLYIARRVLELHGGTISLVRNEPSGSTLRLQFDPRE